MGKEAAFPLWEAKRGNFLKRHHLTKIFACKYNNEAGSLAKEKAKK